MDPIKLDGNIFFKIRFNTMHADTNLYWRIIINDEEYLAATLNCRVNTFSDESFDKNANTTKWHIAGICRHFHLDEDGNASFSD
ncbi:MAG: hypothetical protein BGO69_05940 [Bacteroidetes bacterium 46-16]|nr:MAG: hypothetical protein BGO69_05940 [Bacteroidetes bacterium 46-16]